MLITLLSKPEVCLLLFRLNHGEFMVWSFNIHGRKVSHKTNDSQTVFVYRIVPYYSKKIFLFVLIVHRTFVKVPVKWSMLRFKLKIHDSPSLSLQRCESRRAGKCMLNVTVLIVSDWSRKLLAMIRQSQGLTIEPFTVFWKFLHGLVSENPSPPLKRKPKK